MRPPSPQSGMTLVEVMVGLGISLVLILAVMQAMNFTQRSAKSTSLSGDWNNLTSELRVILNNDAACKQALGTIAIPLNAGATPPPHIPVNKVALATGVVAERGKPDYGLQVTAMHLTADGTTFAVVTDPLGGAGWIRMILTLTVQAEKKMTAGERAVGNSNFTQDLRFAALVDATTRTIAECGSQVSPRQMCYEMGGDYTPGANPPCVLRKYLRECHASPGGCVAGETAITVGGLGCSGTWMAGFAPDGAGGWNANCGGTVGPASAVVPICCKQ